MIRPRVIVIANGGAEVDVVRAAAPFEDDVAIHLRFAPTRALLLPGVATIASIDAKSARATPVDGIHLGGVLRPGLPSARAELGASAWISVPAHTDDEVIAAAREGASAVYVSPIFATPEKGAPRGLDAIRRARELAGDMLVYALGGVDASNAAACIAAGAHGVALIRAFFDAESPRDSLLAVRRAALDRRV